MSDTIRSSEDRVHERYAAHVSAEFNRDNPNGGSPLGASLVRFALVAGQSEARRETNDRTLSGRSESRAARWVRVCRTERVGEALLAVEAQWWRNQLGGEDTEESQIEERRRESKLIRGLPRARMNDRQSRMGLSRIDADPQSVLVPLASEAEVATNLDDVPVGAWVCWSVASAASPIGSAEIGARWRIGP